MHAVGVLEIKGISNHSKYGVYTTIHGQCRKLLHAHSLDEMVEKVYSIRYALHFRSDSLYLPRRLHVHCSSILLHLCGHIAAMCTTFHIWHTQILESVVDGQQKKFLLHLPIYLVSPSLFSLGSHSLFHCL